MSHHCKGSVFIKRWVGGILWVVMVAFVSSCGARSLRLPAGQVCDVPRFNFPHPVQVTLANGMVVYLMEDHELPLFNLIALVRTGSIYEPEGKVGLAELTGVVMRTGGTRSLSAEEVNKLLEYSAGSLETAIGTEAGMVTLSVLKKDITLGLNLFKEVLVYPRFAQDEVELAKKKKEEEIRRSNDNPQSIAFREFKRLLFSQNPRGRIPTLKSIASISGEDMEMFHRQHFHPANIIVGVSGDFKREEMVAHLEELFQDWREKEDFLLPTVASPGEAWKKGVYFVYKEVPQSTIVMGLLTAGKSHPDYYPLQVLNFVVGGGGFNSRLMADIRSRRGLAYSVGSVYSPELEYGVFATYCFTKSESTAECITLIEEILESIRDRGINQEELEWAQRSIINNFIFEFTSASQIVAKKVALAYDKLPQGFLEDYREKIAAVTIEEVHRVAQHYLRPDRMVLLVVGNDKEFDRPLSVFGEVNSLALESEL